jgi:hypothetical protein
LPPPRPIIEFPDEEVFWVMPDGVDVFAVIAAASNIAPEVKGTGGFFDGADTSFGPLPPAFRSAAGEANREVQ